MPQGEHLYEELRISREQPADRDRNVSRRSSRSSRAEEEEEEEEKERDSDGEEFLRPTTLTPPPATTSTIVTMTELEEMRKSGRRTPSGSLAENDYLAPR